MSEQTYTTTKVKAEFHSADHPAFDRHRFAKLVDKEFKTWLAALPTDADYVSQQDLTELGIKTAYWAMNGCPAAVRGITVYDAKTDAFSCIFNAEYLKPVESTEEVPTNG